MNRTLQSMLAKSINEEQSNWSQQPPYVMMAYRISVHESTGYTPHFSVHGQEVCLPIDFMYPNRIDQPPADIHEFVSAQKIQFQKACNSARMALNFNQKCRNTVNNRKLQGPTTKLIKKSYYKTPLFPSVSHTNSVAPGKARILSYNASTTWRIVFRKSKKKKNPSLIITVYNRSMDPHQHQMSPHAIGGTRKTLLHRHHDNMNKYFQILTTTSALSVPYRPFSDHLLSRRCIYNPDWCACIINYTNWFSQVCTT